MPLVQLVLGGFIAMIIVINVFSFNSPGWFGRTSSRSAYRSPRSRGGAGGSVTKVLALLAIAFIIVLAWPFVGEYLSKFTHLPTSFSLPSSTSSSATTVNMNANDRASLIAVAKKDAHDAGVNETYFLRQISAESNWNPKALSPMGAEGIAQFMPATAKALGIDPWNPGQALHAAAFLMASYVQKYGSYAMALAAYNAGTYTVNNAIVNGHANWRQLLPTETQHYIAVILQDSGGTGQ